MFRKLEPRSGRHVLAAVVLINALGVWLVYLGTPLWLLIVCMVAALLVWNRYVQKYLRKQP